MDSKRAFGDNTNGRVINCTLHNLYSHKSRAILMKRVQKYIQVNLLQKLEFKDFTLQFKMSRRFGRVLTVEIVHLFSALFRKDFSSLLRMNHVFKCNI